MSADDGSGDGYGAGYGDGVGCGYGYGAGDGYGSGYGAGDGCGYGYGVGAGDGYGAGAGECITKIGSHTIELLSPACFGYVRIGCQLHTIAIWRERWREIARKHGVSVSNEDAARILMTIELLKGRRRQ